jgi:hypothetical protein
VSWLQLAKNSAGIINATILSYINVLSPYITRLKNITRLKSAFKIAGIIKWYQIAQGAFSGLNEKNQTKETILEKDTVKIGFKSIKDYILMRFEM